jgi:LacI family transcriptional regulator
VATDGGRGRSANLEDIARQAGVSLSTASRVLARARSGGRVDTPKALRVLEVAAELEYEPNLFAASLRTHRTYMLGVLVPHLTDVVLSTIYEGIDERASSAGYQTVVANTMDDPQEQRLRAEKLLQRGVDALVFGDAQIDNPYLDELSARGVPFALASRRHPRYASATCDDYAGGRLAGNHLADLGIDIGPGRLVHSGFDPESGHQVAREIFARDPALTAVFVVNDMAAIGAMGALRSLGRAVGTDVAVVGFNDISIAADLSPPLTSIRSPLREIGREAVELVLERLQQPDADAAPAQTRLPAQLIVRESSDPSVRSRPAGG